MAGLPAVTDCWLGLALTAKSAPAPLNRTAFVPVAFELTVTEPLCAPAADGANATLKLHDAETAMVPEHESPLTV